MYNIANTPRRYVIRKRLLEFFENEKIQPGAKLPSEKEMKEILNVSRLSLREALHLLEEERIVRALHGMGWYLMAKPATVQADISQLKSVTEMFRAYGLELTTKIVSFKIYPIKDTWDDLQLKKGEEIVEIGRIRLSDNEPFIYSIDFIPRKAFKREPRRSEFKESLLNMLDSEYDIRLEYSTAKISVVERADFESSEKMLQQISSWLLLEQVNYDENGVPVIYSRDYHRSDKLQFHVRRYVDASV